MRAAREGHKEIVATLAEKGANLEEKDKNGRTALMYAAEGGHKETVAILAEKGAKLEVKDEDGLTALMMAALGGHKETVAILAEKGTKLEVKDKNGLTALMITAGEGQKETVAILAEKGAKLLEVKDEDGQTALMMAAEEGHKEKVAILVEKGANLEEKDKNGRTALMLAAVGGHEEIVAILAENGANLEVKDQDVHWTTLLLAVIRGHHNRIKTLAIPPAAGKETNVDEKDNEGLTALMLAAVGGRKEIVAILAEKGAKLECKDNDGKSALEYLKDHSLLEVFQQSCNPDGKLYNVGEDRERISITLNAYSQLSVICALILGFIAQTDPHPCKECHHVVFVAPVVVIVLNSLTMALSAVGMVITLVLVYRVNTLLGNQDCPYVGIAQADCFLDKTADIRKYARWATFYSLVFFIGSYGLRVLFSHYTNPIVTLLTLAVYALSIRAIFYALAELYDKSYQVNMYTENIATIATSLRGGKSTTMSKNNANGGSSDIPSPRRGWEGVSDFRF